MKSFRNSILALFVLLLLTFFYSCEENTEEPQDTKGYWKLKQTDTWWVSPGDATHTYVQITEVPFNTVFINENGAEVVYKGSSHSVVRYEKQYDNTLDSIHFTWDQFPTRIDTNIDYNINYESKGNSGNGIMIRYPFYQDDSPRWGTGSFRNGMKSITIRMLAPEDSRKTEPMFIQVNLSSGQYYFIDYYYVYEWVEGK